VKFEMYSFEKKSVALVGLAWLVPLRNTITNPPSCAAQRQKCEPSFRPELQMVQP
jgi:hypothetical protein